MIFRYAVFCLIFIASFWNLKCCASDGVRNPLFSRDFSEIPGKAAPLREGVHASGDPGNEAHIARRDVFCGAPEYGTVTHPEDRDYTPKYDASGGAAGGFDRGESGDAAEGRSRRETRPKVLSPQSVSQVGAMTSVPALGARSTWSLPIPMADCASKTRLPSRPIPIPGRGAPRQHPRCTPSKKPLKSLDNLPMNEWRDGKILPTIDDCTPEFKKFFNYSAFLAFREKYTLGDIALMIPQSLQSFSKGGGAATSAPSKDLLKRFFNGEVDSQFDAMRLRALLSHIDVDVGDL